MDEDDYKDWQDDYEDLEREWDDSWSDERKRDHLKNMEVYNDQEIEGRERARDERGDEADQGHDDRIEKLRDRGQLLKHGIAHAEGRYEYETRRMQDVDDVESEDDDGGEDAAGSSNDGHSEVDEREERVREREENSDMDIQSDSD